MDTAGRKGSLKDAREKPRKNPAKTQDFFSLLYPLSYFLPKTITGADLVTVQLPKCHIANGLVF
jgi:hypothetical protein